MPKDPWPLNREDFLEVQNPMSPKGEGRVGTSRGSDGAAGVAGPGPVHLPGGPCHGSALGGGGGPEAGQRHGTEHGISTRLKP